MALDQGLVNYSQQTKFGLPSVFINEVLLQCSHAHWFSYCLQLLLCYSSKVESLQKQNGLRSLKCLVSCFLHKKLADPRL